MNEPELTLVLIGFGNVARRFVKLLGETADRLDFSWKIAGISTRHHGSVVDPAGVDTRRAIATVEGRQSLDRLDSSPRERSGIDVIKELFPTPDQYHQVLRDFARADSYLTSHIDHMWLKL